MKMYIALMILVILLGLAGVVFALPTPMVNQPQYTGNQDNPKEVIWKDSQGCVHIDGRLTQAERDQIRQANEFDRQKYENEVDEELRHQRRIEEIRAENESKTPTLDVRYR